DGLRLRRLPGLPRPPAERRLPLRLHRGPLHRRRRDRLEGARPMSEAAQADLSVAIGDLALRNPVLTASGTFGYGLEYDDFFDVAELGGICTKGLSLLPRPGNPPDRICETAAGMLNAIGLANVGVEAFCTEKLPVLRSRG